MQIYMHVKFINIFDITDLAMFGGMSYLRQTVLCCMVSNVHKASIPVKVGSRKRTCQCLKKFILQFSVSLSEKADFLEDVQYYFV